MRDDGSRAFAFDNEGPRHKVYLEPFRLAARPVSNGQWIAFIADEGYRRPELWLADGWAAVQAEGWTAPLYWERREDGRMGADEPARLRVHSMKPRRSAMSATTRRTPLPGGPASGCRARPNGKSPPRTSILRATPWAPGISSRVPMPPARRRRFYGRCSAISGNGLPAATRHIHGFVRQPEPSASTMESSCATSWSFVEDPASRPTVMFAPATGTSSTRTSAGSSAACASPKMPETPWARMDMQ